MHDKRFGLLNVVTCTQVSALGAIQYLKGDYTEAANLQRQVLENLSQLKGE
jgi:hypothetical protein